MDVMQIIKDLATGGFATFLVTILVAGKYRIWVWGYILDDIVKDKDAQIAHERAEKDQWRTLALQNRELTDRSVSLATKVVQGAQ